MQVRQGSFPASEVFLIFFLLLPAFAGVMQLLLLNVQLLVIYFINEPVREGFGVAAALLFIAMELSGLVGAVVIFFCLFPVSLMVAASATVSYFVVKRVTVIAVVAAVVAAISLEEISAPGLLASARRPGLGATCPSWRNAPDTFRLRPRIRMAFAPHHFILVNQPSDDSGHAPIRVGRGELACTRIPSLGNELCADRDLTPPLLEIWI